MSKDSKKAFDFSHSSIWVVDPLDLCIVGGARVLKGDERGPNDTNDGPEHPLYRDDLETPLEEEFIASVDRWGVQNPATIQKIDGVAVVIDARTRIRAARLVNARRKARGEPLLKIKADQVRGDELSAMQRMMIGNYARKTFEPLQRAADAKLLLARGVSEADVCVTLKMSDSRLRALLTLDDATNDVKDAVIDGTLPVAAGVEIGRAKPEVQRETVSRIRAKQASAGTTGKAATVTEARRTVKQVEGSDTDGDEIGITGRKNHKALLEALATVPGEFGQGARAVILAVLGIGKPDPRIAGAVDAVLGGGK